MLKKTALCVLVLLCVAFCGCDKNAEVGTASDIDYSNSGNWAYINYGEEQPADCFFIDSLGVDDSQNEASRNEVICDVNKQMGMYTDNCRFFAPFYKDGDLTTEYDGVKSAFDCYMESYNDGRPVVLASNANGGELLIKLLQDELETFSDRFVAAYAVGYGVTEDEIEGYTQITVAQQSNDVGVLVSFITSDGYEMNALDKKTVGINPLNWEATGDSVDESYNMGACFFDEDGVMTDEVYQFCGAYIDEETGSLKLTNIADDKDYIAASESNAEYMLFYRNIQYNVAERVEAFFGDDN